MIATLITTRASDNTVSTIRTLTSVTQAQEMLESLSTRNNPLHGQILVDYANVQFYKDKYEELFNMFICKNTDKPKTSTLT